MSSTSPELFVDELLSSCFFFLFAMMASPHMMRSSRTFPTPSSLRFQNRHGSSSASQCFESNVRTSFVLCFFFLLEQFLFKSFFRHLDRKARCNERKWEKRVSLYPDLLSYPFGFLRFALPFFSLSLWLCVSFFPCFRASLDAATSAPTCGQP